MDPETSNIESNPEQELLAALAASQKTLGSSIRLVTQKPQVAMNATKHQLTGQCLFMPPEELSDYLDVGYQMIQDLQPMGMLEAQFAQRIIDANWRLNRAGALDGVAFNARLARASREFIANNPGETERTTLVNSQAEACNKECVDLLEKIGRHSSRTQRDLLKTMSALQEMQAIRLRKRGNLYNIETCPVYAWYRKLSDLADRLVDAREEVRIKSIEQNTPVGASVEAVSDSEQTPSSGTLFCKKTLHLVTPLTPETEELIRDAARYGLLLDPELTLFTQRAAA